LHGKTRAQEKKNEETNSLSNGRGKFMGQLEKNQKGGGEKKAKISKRGMREEKEGGDRGGTKGENFSPPTGDPHENKNKRGRKTLGFGEKKKWGLLRMQRGRRSKETKESARERNDP